MPLYFNPRPRAGGDAGVLVGPLGDDKISTHAPAQGATPTICKKGATTTFQPTPPRRGRLPSPPYGQRRSTISTHAPAQGATVFLGKLVKQLVKFQPTPPRRGRREWFYWTGCPWHFNPRPRAGGDWTSTPEYPPNIISTHAPAQGATLHIVSNIQQNTRFSWPLLRKTV